MVYRFRTFDINTGDMVTQPIKSTAARIATIPNAQIIEGTGEEVPDEAVDDEGRCYAQRP
jgi:hypothetical protein